MSHRSEQQQQTARSTHHMRPRLVMAIAALLAAASGMPAHAAPVYNSFAKVETISGSDTAAGGQTAVAAHAGGVASAVLFPGAVNLVLSNPGITIGNAGGDVTLSDLIFTKLPGFSGNPNTFAGTLHVTQDSDAAPGDMSAGASLNPIGQPGGGLDTTLVPGQDLSITDNALQVGIPYELMLQASIRTTTAPDDAFLLLHLRDVTVFDLPEGYTVNSTDGLIQDNVYTGQIPEPASLAVFALGVCFACRRRRA